MADEDPVTFGELKDALTPPGTERDALWAALKGSEVKGVARAELLGKIADFQRTGGHVPGGDGPDISLGRATMGTTCAPCNAIGILATHVPNGDECRMVRAVAEQQLAPWREPAMPADPFGRMTPGAIAATAMHEAFLDLVAGGFTRDEALTIIARAYAAANGRSDG